MQHKRPWTKRTFFTALTLVLDALVGVVAVLATDGFDQGIGILLLVSGLVLLRAFGLYRERPELRVLDDLPRILISMLIAASLPAALLLIAARYAWLSEMTTHFARLDGKAGNTLHQVQLLIVATGWWMVAEPIARRLAYSTVLFLRKRKILSHRTVIVGLYNPSRVLARTLLEHPGYGLDPIGFLSANPESVPEGLELPVLGDIGDIARVVQETGADHVIVGETIAPPLEVIGAVRECDRLDVEVFLIPAMHDLARGALNNHIWSVPIIRMPRRAFRSDQWLAKRAADRLVAAIGLLLTGPIIGIAAFLVVRETKGRAIFRQRRVGLDGREFDVLKLQTMVPENASDSEETWNISHSDRLGPVGRFLRKTSIDELPQLWNVLRGDMSLVGPRPERPHFVEEFQRQFPLYLARHRVPCGVTGYAQIHGLRGDTSIEDRVAFDNLYIESWSLWLDIKILLRTIPAILRGSGG